MNQSLKAGSQLLCAPSGSKFSVFRAELFSLVCCSIFSNQLIRTLLSSKGQRSQKHDSEKLGVFDLFAHSKKYVMPSCSSIKGIFHQYHLLLSKVWHNPDDVAWCLWLDYLETKNQGISPYVVLILVLHKLTYLHTLLEHWRKLWLQPLAL